MSGTDEDGGLGVDSQEVVSTIDSGAYRNVLGHYPTGVCAVAAMVDGVPVGMIVGSFTSLSLDPPLVAFMPDKASSTFAILREANVFAANILSSSQEDVCRRLASKTLVDKWDGIAWHPGQTGAPILDDAVAWVECEVENRYDGGDHWIVIGRVRDLAVQSNVLPLLFFQGAYGRFSPASFVARSEVDLINELEIADSIRDELEALSRATGLECTAAVRVDREIVVVARAGNTAGANPRRAVGMRIPFVPPMGSPFSAFDPAAFDLWVSQLSAAEDSVVEMLRLQVARVRERGWSLALRSPGFALVEDLLHEFTLGTYTPAAEKQLRTLIESLGDYFDPEDLDPSVEYEVNSLRAPVFDQDGRAALSILLIGPRDAVKASEILAWRETLLTATGRMSHTIKALARRPAPALTR